MPATTFPDAPATLKWIDSRARALVRQTPGFLRSCYVDGTQAILAGRFDRRQAGLIIAAMVPTLLSVALITIPSFLFPTQAHKAYFEFARILSNDPVSMVPLIISTVTATIGLRVPVG